jgi:hypothetical protein
MTRDVNVTIDDLLDRFRVYLFIDISPIHLQMRQTLFIQIKASMHAII